MANVKNDIKIRNSSLGSIALNTHSYSATQHYTTIVTMRHNTL